jgi:hypothetical protein
MWALCALPLCRVVVLAGTSPGGAHSI